MRVNRSTQVEGAYGVIKQDIQYERFRRTSIKKVETELRGSMEWIYGFSRSSVWLSKMWNFPFSMFSEIVLPMTVLPPAIFATSI